MRTLPLSESSRGDVVASIAQFLSPRNPFQVLIVSYETYRIHSQRFRCARACALREGGGGASCPASARHMRLTPIPGLAHA